jgi:hypothetical protein
MSEVTKELLNQSMKTERECQKLQALLHDKLPNVAFKWSPENDELLLFKTEKKKRQRTVIHDDNPEGDENDEPEVKPKLDILFKREDDDNDNDTNNVNDNDTVNANDNDEDDNDENLIEFLSNFSQQLQNVPVTWGDKSQSPWSQYEEPAEQNHVIVPNITEPIQIPYLYTPEGVGLYFLILSFIYIYFL